MPTVVVGKERKRPAWMPWLCIHEESASLFVLSAEQFVKIAVDFPVSSSKRRRHVLQCPLAILSTIMEIKMFEIGDVQSILHFRISVAECVVRKEQTLLQGLFVFIVDRALRVTSETSDFEVKQSLPRFVVEFFAKFRERGRKR